MQVLETALLQIMAGTVELLSMYSEHFTAVVVEEDLILGQVVQVVVVGRGMVAKSTISMDTMQVPTRDLGEEVVGGKIQLMGMEVDEVEVVW